MPAAATDGATTCERYRFSTQANAECRAWLQMTANGQSDALEAAQLRALFIRVAVARLAT